MAGPRWLGLPLWREARSADLKDADRAKAVPPLVHAAVRSFVAGFQGRHEGERDDPEGTLNMKIHNPFIAALGPEIQYWTAMSRSFDSSLGNMLETLAISIAELSFEVQRAVEGPVSKEQRERIAELLESYKNRAKSPTVGDYQKLRAMRPAAGVGTKRHESDYYLIDREKGLHTLIELKIGGDLDNKKARSEKEALLEQFAILSNSLPKGAPIRVVFATAYNRYGEGKPWRQERVRQFFADEELLIGGDFWNFVCRLPNGYDLVLAAYRDCVPEITAALESIRRKYLG